MKERLKAIAPKIGFPLFYLFCLVLFARWTFPYEKVRDRIVLAYNQQQRESGGQQELKIDELGSSWSLLGVSFKGLRLLGPPSEPGKAPSEMKIDDGSASVSLFGLLFGAHDVSFRASAFGGTIKGSFDDSAKERAIDLDLDSVDLGQIPQVAQALSVPVEGTLDGTIKLTMPDQKASKATGNVSLDMANVSVGDGKAKIMGLLALPKVVIGPLAIAGDAKDGVLKFTKIAAGGKDLDVQGDGRVQLREQLGDSFTDLNLRVKINDTYRGKSDTTKSLFGAPGSTKGGDVELLVPQVKQSKRPDGFYGWHMHGPLSRPAFDPAPSGGATPSAPGMAPNPMMGNPGGGTLR